MILKPVSHKTCAVLLTSKTWYRMFSKWVKDHFSWFTAIIIILLVICMTWNYDIISKLRLWQLIAEQSCQILPRSDLKQRSFRLFKEHLPNRNNNSSKMSSNMGSVCTIFCGKKLGKWGLFLCFLQPFGKAFVSYVCITTHTLKKPGPVRVRYWNRMHFMLD